MQGPKATLWIAIKSLEISNMQIKNGQTGTSEEDHTQVMKLNIKQLKKLMPLAVEKEKETLVKGEKVKTQEYATYVAKLAT